MQPYKALMPEELKEIKDEKEEEKHSKKVSKGAVIILRYYFQKEN